MNDEEHWFVTLATGAVRVALRDDERVDEQLWLVWFNGDLLTRKVCLLRGASNIAAWVFAVVREAVRAWEARYVLVHYTPRRCVEAEVAAEFATAELRKLGWLGRQCVATVFMHDA